MNPFTANIGVYEIILALITGGGLTALFTFIISKKKEDRNDFEHIIKVWEEDNKRLRDKNDRLRKRVLELEVDNVKLKAQVIMMERDIDKLKSRLDAVELDCNKKDSEK